MAVNIKQSELDVFNNNGISTDSIRDTINVYRKQGISDEEIQEKFQAKLNQFTTKQQEPQQTQEPSTEYSGPSYLTGATRKALGGLTLGATPYIAGYTNVLAEDLADITQGDLATKAKGYGKYLMHQLVPMTAVKSESFRRGQQAYQEEQKKFEEAYPTTATAAEIVGSIPTYVVGAGEISAALKGTKVLANAPKVVKTLTTSVGALQPLAVQKGVEESLKEDSKCF